MNINILTLVVGSKVNCAFCIIFTESFSSWLLLYKMSRLASRRLKFVWSFVVTVFAAAIALNWIYFFEQNHCVVDLQHQQICQNRSSPIRSSFKNIHGHVGYVISLGSQQQGRGVQGIISMQCWLISYDLPMHIVEPMVSSSKFLGLPSSKKRSVDFGDIYDIDQLNKITGVDKKFAQIVRWDDFFQNAPRSIIFVMVRPGNYHHVEVKWEMQLQQKDTYNNTKPLYYLLDRGFVLVKVLKVLTSDHQPFTARELNKVIFNNWSPDEVTLIFSRWHPLTVIPNPKLENPLLCYNRYNFDGHQFFPPSKQLLQAVQNYENLFLKPYTSIAVIISSEHVLKKWLDQSLLYPTITTIFNNLIATVRKLQASIGHGNIIVTADIGKYGSNTWGGTVSGRDKNIIVETIKHTVTTLYNNSWTFEEWEQSFGTATGGIEDQSYIAAMQKSIASRAQCLLLFGGGGYELIALHEYLHNHPIPSKQCWKFLHSKNSFERQYSQLIAHYSGIRIDDVSESDLA